MVQSVPCQSKRLGSADDRITITLEVVGVCYVPNCVRVHLVVWLQGKTSQTETWNWHLKQTLMHIHQKTKTFLLRVIVTLTMIQMALLTQTSKTGVTVQTVDLLYL